MLYLRINPTTFNFLINLIHDDIQKMGTNWRTPISTEEQLVVAIAEHLLEIKFKSLCLGFDETGTEWTANESFHIHLVRVFKVNWNAPSLQYGSYLCSHLNCIVTFSSRAPAGFAAWVQLGHSIGVKCFQYSRHCLLLSATACFILQLFNRSLCVL